MDGEPRAGEVALAGSTSISRRVASICIDVEAYLYSRNIRFAWKLLSILVQRVLSEAKVFLETVSEVEGGVL